MVATPYSLSPQAETSQKLRNTLGFSTYIRKAKAQLSQLSQLSELSLLLWVVQITQSGNDSSDSCDS
jgi:hypothetical protein